MRILITGASGQLGNELQKVIKNKTSEIGTISNIYDNAEVIAVDVDKLDITDKGAVLSFVHSQEPDIIINCAAYTNVDACEQNVDIAYKINAGGSLNLAQAASEVHAEFIHVSTDYVFNGFKTDGISYREWDKTDPQSIYGKSKLMSEDLVLQNCNSSYVVRTSWLYGYEGNNFVKTILNLAKNNEQIKVVNDQMGNPTSASDVAHHLLKLPFSKNYGIYHCTNQEICSWFDFAKLFVELSGIKCQVIPCTTEEFPRPAKRPAFSALDNMGLRNTVGDEMRTWQEAIKSYMGNTKR